MQWGKTESHKVSRFVREIDRRFLAGVPDAEPAADSWGQRPFQSRSFDRSSASRPAVSSRTAPQPVCRPTFSAPASARPASAGFQADPIADLRQGQRVEHDRFGFGEILRFEESGPQMKAIVRFDEGGEKTLLLKFAKLRIVR